MANPINYLIHLDGIDVTSLCSSSKTERTFNNNISGGKLILKSSIINTGINFDINNVYHSVEIWRGVTTSTENKLFKGEIVRFKNDNINIECDIADDLQKAVRRTITYSFDKDIDAEAGVISELFKTLVNDYTDLTADDTSVVNSGTVNVLTKFICNNVSVFEKLKELADILDWQFYYNPSTDKIHFEPKGTPSSGETLTVGDNIVKRPVWAYDKSMLCNKLKIIGAEEITETTEDGQVGVTTGYTTTQIQLKETPFSCKVYADAANPPTTLRTGGNEVTGTYDYSIDVVNKLILWNTGTYAPLNNHFVEVRYSYKLSRPILIKNQVSIDKYTLHEKRFYAKDLQNISDLEVYAKKYIAKYKTPFLSSNLKIVDIANLYPGQTVQVIDSNSSIGQELLVTSVRINYPYIPDEITVSDKQLRLSDWGSEISNRISKLEESTQQADEVLTHIIDYDRVVQYFRQSMKLVKRVYDDPEPNVFILGSSKYGVLGTNKLGNQSGSAFETKYMWNHDSSFKDYLTKTDNLDPLIKTTDYVGSYVGLQGWWKLNGNYTDATSNGFDGTTGQAPSSDTVNKKLGTGSYYFDGTGEHITTSASDLLQAVNNFSVSLWFKRDGTYASDDILFSNVNTSNIAVAGFMCWIDNVDDKIHLIIKDGTNNTNIVGTTVLQDDDWHHMVLVIDRSGDANCKLYIDNSDVGVVSGSGIENLGDCTNSAKLTFGTGPNGTYIPFKGNLEEIMFWNRALTSTDAENLNDLTYFSGAIDTSTSTITLNNSESYKSDIIAYSSGTDIEEVDISATTTGAVNWYTKTDTNAWEYFGRRVLLLKLNESTGNPSDSSDFANDGTLSGCTWTPNSAPDGINYSLYFDGVNDYINLNTHKTDTEFNMGQGSISFWIKPAADMTDAYSGVMNYRKVSTADYLIIRYYRSSVGITQAIGVAGEVSNVNTINVKSADNSVPLGEWTHVVINQSGSAITIYINGEETILQTGAGAGNTGHWFEDTFPANTDFNIGHPGSWTYYFKGYLSNFQIKRRPLTTTEITSQYNNQSVPLTDNYTLTNSGEKLYLRATETAGSSATITSLIQADYS